MKRRRRSKSEWHGILADWRASGLSVAEFSREHGVPAARLSWWAARKSAPKPRRSYRRMERVEVVELKRPRTRPEVCEASSSMFEVVLANGRSLSFPSDVAPHRVAALLTVLEAS